MCTDMFMGMCLKRIMRVRRRRAVLELVPPLYADECCISNAQQRTGLVVYGVPWSGGYAFTDDGARFPSPPSPSSRHHRTHGPVVPTAAARSDETVFFSQVYTRTHAL